MHNKIFIVHLFLCLLLNVKINAQNLVPNPSFESYTLCPDAAGQIDRASPWKHPSVGATIADADYYNLCALTWYYGVPGGASGFQYAKTGNAYAGIFNMQQGLEVRDYLQVGLLDTLEMNKCYVVTFYVSLLNRAIYASNNLSANFLDTAFVQPNYYPVNLQSHIYKFGNPLITDTLDWIEIKGIYASLGNERFISIGNFKNDADTDTLNINPWPDGTLNGSYYLVDDVSVVPIDSITGGMSAFAGNDTNVVLGDSVFIGQQITNLNCNWYIGSTLIADSVSGLYVNPTVNTTYIVEQNLCGTITYDTVLVIVLPVGINENDRGSKINLYPNPSNGEFTVELPEGNILWKISVTDMQGRTIYEDVSDNKKISLNHVIENGIYIVHIDNLTTNETCIRKMVIQK